MQTFYYPRTIKNITVAIMDMFNNMIVKKYDENNNFIEDMIVPFQFGPVEKYHLDRIENHYYDVSAVEHGQRFYLMIPRMAMTLDGVTYNPNRAYGVNEWRYWFAETLELSGTNLSDVFSDYQPTPYDLTYTLHIKTDKIDYFAQILENILPYFNPMLSLRVKEFSFLNVERDLPVYIESVTPEFVDDMGEQDSREVNAAIIFRVEAFMYRPFSQSKVIKIIQSRYFIGGVENYTSAGNPTFTTSATYQVTEYRTSGYDTSGGTISAINMGYNTSGSNTSGHFISDSKDFYWITSAAAKHE